MSPKLIWPVVGTIVMATLTTLQDALTDEKVDAQEWVLVALGVLMAFNVWATANLPQYTKMKGAVAAAIAAVGALHTFIIGGVSTAEIVNMAVLALSAAGVLVARQPLTKVIDGQTIPPNAPAHN